VFVVEELARYRDEIPEGKSIAERVHLLIDFLLQIRTESGTSAFVLFLQILKDRYSPEDGLHEKLSELVAEVQTNINFPLIDFSSRKSNLTYSIFGLPDKKYTYDLFVLMPFASNLKPVYDDHIKKVAGELSLSIARADDFFSQNSIMQEVWSAIAQASILIADCTGKNPNVFYEIGLAHAIGKPVILVTQNPDDVPFDLRHRRYILYAYTPPGMKLFESVLSSTILETKKDLASTK
jgi:hypothetical protein